MDKLKTLKEMVRHQNHMGICESELRAEAVKWAKVAKLSGDKSTYFQFKHFFNLTEAELSKPTEEKNG